MPKQLLLNRGFEDGLTNFNIQGTVSSNIDIAHSGIKSALLLANPTQNAELSQVVPFLMPGTIIRFSFRARKFLNSDVQCVSNVRAEVNFLNTSETIISPGLVISIRGRNLSKKRWSYYDEYAEIPVGTVAAQVVIRLEPPQIGNSGLLVDDLALVGEAISPLSAITTPVSPTLIPNPAQQTNPSFPGWPIMNIAPQQPEQKLKSKQSYDKPTREIVLGTKEEK